MFILLLVLFFVVVGVVMEIKEKPGIAPVMSQKTTAKKAFAPKLDPVTAAPYAGNLNVHSLDNSDMLYNRNVISNMNPTLSLDPTSDLGG